MMLTGESSRWYKPATALNLNLTGRKLKSGDIIGAVTWTLSAEASIIYWRFKTICNL